MFGANSVAKPESLQESVDHPEIPIRRRQKGHMNISIPLTVRTSDKDESIYYIANRLPIFSLNLNEGYVFFIFLSEEGAEEIQIGAIDSELNKFSRYSVFHDERSDKVKFKLFRKTDRFGKTFYVGTLKLSAEMTFHPEDSSIMVFTSIADSEECQLQGTLVYLNR